MYMSRNDGQEHVMKTEHRCAAVGKPHLERMAVDDQER